MHTFRRTWFALCAIAIAIAMAGVTSQAAQLPATPSTALDLARFHGQVVVVDFWASWCKPCRQSIPWLNELRARYGTQGLVVIGVNVDAERADAERFQRSVPIDFEVLYDPQGKLAQQFGVQGMPSSFVFDRDGKLAQTLLGFREARRDQHEAEIQNLLHRKTS
jgi:thiol-disulfide isomerase/thioredoxin